jgi:hypothetical protein
MCVMARETVLYQRGERSASENIAMPTDHDEGQCIMSSGDIPLHLFSYETG